MIGGKLKVKEYIEKLESVDDEEGGVRRSYECMGVFKDGIINFFFFVSGCFFDILRNGICFLFFI